jgi:hypothetical protein
MNNKRLYPLLAILLSSVLLVVLFSGCIEEDENSRMRKESIVETCIDKPSVLPDWNDGEYHNYEETIDMVNYFNDNYPNLVDISVIGKSVLDKDIWCICITNESSVKSKFSCLIDGCIHGCEWEAGEACLYLAEYLLINYDLNSTITNLLDGNKIYIVPLLNPDARNADDRFNDNGIDLNRNFDVDFGRIRGSSIPLGKLFGRVKISYMFFPRLHKWLPGFPSFLTNCGRRAFSEPETRALRDFMREVNNHGFSFYVNCHTAMHLFSNPWSCFKPPFEMSEQEKKVYNCVKEWVSKNSEYEDKPISYYASGTATDWFFKEFRVPSFTFEILSTDYEPGAGGGKHDNLVHWMKTTLPVFMYLLVNIENLHNWQTLDIQPALPEGVPPEPLS